MVAGPVFGIVDAIPIELVFASVVVLVSGVSCDWVLVLLFRVYYYLLALLSLREGRLDSPLAIPVHSRTQVVRYHSGYSPLVSYPLFSWA